MFIDIFLFNKQKYLTNLVNIYSQHLKNIIYKIKHQNASKMLLINKKFFFFK